MTNWSSTDYVSHYNDNYSTSLSEFLKLSEYLNIGKGDILIDFGCGNGQFLESCSDRISLGIGVDCSLDQVLSAKKRLEFHPHIKVLRSSFLDFKSDGLKFTRGFSRKALHHLDDMEKIVFFKNIGKDFVEGSFFLIEDGIFFNFERDELDLHWNELIREASEYYGSSWEKKQKDVEDCFRFEFPTGINAWNSALTEAGFAIIETRRYSNFYGSILAQKKC
jgi:SAM-dependent methyltransferase